MNPLIRPATLLSLLLMTAPPAARACDEPADLVLTGGDIHTMDPERPTAEALAIRGGRILALGSTAEIEALAGPATRRFDLGQGMALPGFHDPHIHPVSGGYTLLGCSLLGESSVDALLDKLRECAAREPEGWLRGMGFDLSLFPGGRMDKAMLDQLFPQRPVYLEASDGHTGWVNSQALEIARIDATTPDPHGGEIARDADTGEPTGTLFDTAMDLLEPHLPQRTLATDIEALRTAQSHLHRLGVTSITELAYNPRNWEAWQALEAAGELQLRVRSALVYGPYAEYPVEQFDTLFAGREQYRSELFSNDSVKLFLDGTLEPLSAYLLEPYAVDPPHRGKLNFEPEELARLVSAWDAAGVQVHMHAIGDGAVRAGLDAVEAARAANGPRDNRHHITHLQLVHPDDYPRFGELNVTANFQALWAYPDSWIMDLNLPVVGMERVQRMYPIASIHDAGGRIAGSSDWDVSSAYPPDAIETAVRRQDANAPDGPVLNAAERVDLATMLAAYTTNGAYLMHHEDLTGMLRPGMAADVVVLDRDLFDIPPSAINDARVLLTLFGGEVVYEARPAPGTNEMQE